MEQTKKGTVDTLRIAATYIGTVVGAGFASGQEILQFFTVFGPPGYAGLLTATIMFMVFGYIIMELGKKLNARSHLEITRHTGGKYIGSIIDYIITFFLFGALAAMIAGSGSLVEQQFGISSLPGSLLMTAAAVITVLTGISGVINSISVVVPFLLASAVGVSIVTVFIIPYNPGAIQAAAPQNGLIGSWLWAAVLYVSYNTVLSVSVLGALGSRTAGKKPVLYGAVLGGLGLGLGSLAINMAMMKNLDTIRVFEIPMAAIAGRISSAVQIVYIVVLIAEIYTTATGSLYGFAARVTDPEGKKSALVIIITAAAAFAASRFGFTNLVRYMYPLVGYAGILLLSVLLYSRIRLSLRH